MSSYTPAFKHSILTLYSPHVKGSGFKSLARRFGIQGGGALVKYWYDHWDGTHASLERKPVHGRPAILHPVEIAKHITGRIRKSNRIPRPIHYRELADTIKKATGKTPSLQTIRRYGRVKAGITLRRTSKRTAHECKFTGLSLDRCFSVLAD
jgi:hypothetical protein